MRGAKASYDKALWLLARAKELADYPVLTKSGIIVGLGETNDEVVETMRDLRAHGVDVVTIGQYLQPSREARDDRPLGAPRRVPLVPRAGRGARLRLRLRRPARALELPRRRAAPRRRDRPRRRRLLTVPSRRRAGSGSVIQLRTSEPVEPVREVEALALAVHAERRHRGNHVRCPRRRSGRRSRRCTSRPCLARGWRSSSGCRP